MARVEPTVQSGGLLKLYQALWAPYYQAVLNTLGSTGVVLPLCDPHHGQPTTAFFTTKGEERVTFTWSEPPRSFDTPLDLTDADSFQGIVPVIELNGTDEEADTPDAAYWSRGDGSSDSAVSMGFWVNLDTLTSTPRLFDRYAGGAEWRYLVLSTGELRFQTRDNSAGIEVKRESSAGAIATGQWYFLVATYDGAGGATAMDGATLYRDGAVLASTATNNGSYVAMENGTGVTKLGQEADGAGGELDGRIAGGPLGPFFTQKELTADEIRALYDLGRAGLGL